MSTWWSWPVADCCDTDNAFSACTDTEGDADVPHNTTAAHLRHAHIVKGDGVNGDFVPPRKVLLDACQEGMREVEAGDPEDRWGPLLNPLAEHAEALYEISDVAAQGLHAGVGLGHPQGGHPPIIHCIAHLL